MSVVFMALTSYSQIYHPEKDAKEAFSIETGYMMHGVKKLQKTIPTYVGVSLHILPEKRFHDVIQAQYARYETFNTLRSGDVVRYKQLFNPDQTSKVFYCSLFYKKIWRIQSYKYTRHRLYVKTGIGFQNVTIKERGGFYFGHQSSHMPLTLSGGFTYEYTLNNRRNKDVRVSIRLSASAYLPIGTPKDSFNIKGSIKKYPLDEFKSTTQILRTKPKMLVAGVKLTPRYISPKERRRRDSLKWVKRGLSDAYDLTRELQKNRPLLKPGGSTTLTDVISSLPGVSAVGVGREAKIKVREHVSFRGLREVGEGNHPDAKDIRYDGQEEPNLNYKYDEPIFVLDGVIWLGAYADLYDILQNVEIDDIKVLKGPDTAFYGAKGANGVIEITTKKY